MKEMNLRIVSIYSLVALWVGIACLVSSNAIAAENKEIVTVNIQEVLLSSSSGQAVKKVLEEKVLEFQEKFQTEQEEVEAMRAEIEKKSSVWSQQVREEKEREYQKMVRELQVKSEDAQFEMQQLEKQIMEPVVQELQKVIADMGEKNSYAMIIDSRAGLLYFDKTLDISELVTKELDSRQKAKKQDK
jgi:outer membrane protein